MQIHEIARDANREVFLVNSSLLLGSFDAHARTQTREFQSHEPLGSDRDTQGSYNK